MSENKANENKIEIKPVHWVYIGFTAIILIVVLVVLSSSNETVNKNPLTASSTETIPSTFEGIDQHISERGIGTKIDIPGIRTKITPKSKKVKSKDAIIDSLKKENLALHEKIRKLKNQLSDKKPTKRPVVVQKKFNIEKYLKNVESTRHVGGKKKQIVAENPWVKLKFLEGLTLFQGSRVSLETQKDIVLKGKKILRGAFVEGICSLSRDRLFLDFYRITTKTNQIKISGKAYQLIDRSLGVRVIIKKSNAEEEFMKSLSGKATDIINKIDPYSALKSTRNSQKKGKSDVFTEISDDTIILARIVSVERN